MFALLAPSLHHVLFISFMFIVTHKPVWAGDICCNVRLTVKHLLTDCPKYRPKRLKCNLPTDLCVLLGQEYPKEDLFNFLKEIKIMDRI